MKLREMIPEIRYLVTKGGVTLKEGDSIWLDLDGYLMNIRTTSWLIPLEWRRLRNEVRFHKEYYEKEIEKFRAKINLCESLIERYAKERSDES